MNDNLAGKLDPSQAPFKPARAGRAVSHAGLEALEQRQLLAAHLGLFVVPTPPAVVTHAASVNDGLPAGEYSASVDSTGLPIAVIQGSGLTGSAQVTINNLSNDGVIPEERVNIVLVARPIGAVDSSQDVILGEALNQRDNFDIGQSQSYAVPVTLPNDLAAGTYNVVAIMDSTNDDYPEFTATAAGTLTVAAVPPPVVDLTIGFGNVNLPQSVVSGAYTLFPLPVVVTNNGTGPVNAGQTITISFYARPNGAEDSSGDVFVCELLNVPIGGLAPGKSASFTATVTVPLSVNVAGNYQMVAVADSANVVPEINENNNTAVTDGSIAVTPGVKDLSASLGNVTFPPVVLTGSTATRVVPVTVVNSGTTPISSGRLIAISVAARPVGAEGSFEDILLTPADESPDRSVSGLMPGASKTFNIKVTLPANMPPGSYNIVATVDATDAVYTDTNRANNTAVSSSTFSIVPNLPDLVDSIGQTTLPAHETSGDGSTFLLPVTVSNQGHIPVAAGQVVTISIYARPVGAEDSSQDVLVATFSGQSISGLKVHKSVNFLYIVSLPVEVASGNVNLVAVVDSTNLVAEVNENNNSAVSSGSIAVTQGTNDLQIAFNGNASLPETILSGAGDIITVPVAITNQGNVPIGDDPAVDINFYARPVGAEDSSQDILLDTLTGVSVGGLAPDQEKDVSGQFLIPFYLTGGNYEFVAVIDTNGQVMETDTANNTAVSTQTFAVTQGTVDLQPTLDTVELPPSEFSGSGDQIALPIILHNNGDVPVQGGQLISIAIFARPVGAEDSSQDVLIQTLDGVDISGLPAGGTQEIDTDVTLPITLPSGQYNLVVDADSNDNLIESDESNNVAVTAQAIVVTQGTIDLQPTLDTASLPASVVAGGGQVITLPIVLHNNGTVMVQQDQFISMAVYARPAGAEDSSQDVLLETLDGQDISGLPAGGSEEIDAGVTLPQSLAAGSYKLVVVADSNNDVAESDETNNVAVTAGAVNATVGAADLAATGGSTGFGATAASGQGGFAQVNIQNTGTLIAGTTVNVTFYATLNGVVDGSSINLGSSGDQFIQLNPGDTTSVGAFINLPSPQYLTDYEIVAVFTTPLTETTTANNTASVGDVNVLGTGIAPPP